MAKRRKKTKSARCKNYVVHRPNDDCSGKKGANACHPSFVKVGKSKYTGPRGALGIGVGGRTAGRAPKVAVCKLGSKLMAVTPGGSNVNLRRLR